MKLEKVAYNMDYTVYLAIYFMLDTVKVVWSSMALTCLMEACQRAVFFFFFYFLFFFFSSTEQQNIPAVAVILFTLELQLYSVSDKVVLYLMSIMNSYIISLIVTAEQENAIIDLYTDRCWAYLKTGESIRHFRHFYSSRHIF